MHALYKITKQCSPQLGNIIFALETAKATSRVTRAATKSTSATLGSGYLVYVSSMLDGKVGKKKNSLTLHYYPCRLKNKDIMCSTIMLSKHHSKQGT